MTRMTSESFNLSLLTLLTQVGSSAIDRNLAEKKLAGFVPMNALQHFSPPPPPPPHRECSAHDLTCIRDSWTARTFYQQATETAHPLYLHCRRLRFYTLTGSRSELQQRPLLLLPAVRVHPHTLQIIFHSEMHVFKAIVGSHLRRSVFHLQACVLNLWAACLYSREKKQRHGAPSWSHLARYSAAKWACSSPLLFQLCSLCITMYLTSKWRWCKLCQQLKIKRPAIFTESNTTVSQQSIRITTTVLRHPCSDWKVALRLKIQDISSNSLFLLQMVHCQNRIHPSTVFCRFLSIAFSDFTSIMWILLCGFCETGMWCEVAYLTPSSSLSLHLHSHWHSTGIWLPASIYWFANQGAVIELGSTREVLQLKITAVFNCPSSAIPA